MKKLTLLIGILLVSLSATAQKKLKLEDNTNANTLFFRNSYLGVGTDFPRVNLHVKSSFGAIYPAIFETESFTSSLLLINAAGFPKRVEFRNSNGDAQIKVSGNSKAFIVKEDGKVGMGTFNPDSKLTVKGKIHAEEVLVDLDVPADYVFEKYFTGSSNLNPNYTMPTLSEIESFIKENNHLPAIPSAKDIQEKGLKVGEMTNLLLQKIEELTLYTIEQQKQIDALKQQITNK